MNTSAIDALWEHRDFLLASGIAIYFLSKLVRKGIDGYKAVKAWVQSLVSEGIPAAVKATLQNGGGEVVRRIVAEENARQSVHHLREVQRAVCDAIKEHTLACPGRKVA